MTITGTIKRIGDTVQVSEKFKKREIWIETSNDQYPQTLSIEFNQDKTAILDKYTEGQEVEVSINLRGRVWTNAEGVEKVFNSIQGWRIQVAGTGTDPVDEPAVDSNEPSSDLPF